MDPSRYFQKGAPQVIKNAQGKKINQEKTLKRPSDCRKSHRPIGIQLKKKSSTKQITWPSLRSRRPQGKKIYQRKREVSGPHKGECDAKIFQSPKVKTPERKEKINRLQKKRMGKLLISSVRRGG